MANIQQRRTRDGKVTYRVQVRRLGFPAQSATFERKTDAKSWAAQMETALSEGRHMPSQESKRRTLADLIDRYLETIQRSRPHAFPKQSQLLGWWRDRLGSYALVHVTPARIAEARDVLLSETTYRNTPRSPATTNRYLAALGAAMTRAVREWHWLDDNPVRKVTKNKESLGRTRFLSRDELTALFDACANSKMAELSLIVRLAVSTGMRRGEILGLRWSDVHLDRSVVTIEHTKNGERRTVPIGVVVRAMLIEHRGDQTDESAIVFNGNRGSRPIEVRDAFEDALKRARIENATFHTLRHTTASYLAMSGATLSDIAAVLGHKTLAMVKRYSHVSEQHTAGVLERMNAKFLG